MLSSKFFSYQSVVIDIYLTNCINSYNTHKSNPSNIKHGRELTIIKDESKYKIVARCSSQATKFLANGIKKLFKLLFYGKKTITSICILCFLNFTPFKNHLN